MSVSSRNGVLAYGGQTAKESLATAFYRHKTLDINLGAIEQSARWAPEVGGSVFNQGQRKTASYVGGTATIQPRIANVFGWLLYAMTGSVSTVDDHPEAGANTHIFKPATDHAYLPWLTMHKYVPGATSADAIGEILQDCKVAQAVFSMAAMAPLTMQVGVLGREPSFEEAPSWTYENAYEDVESVPTGNSGYFKLPTFSADALEVTSVEVTLANQLSAARLADEMVIGSYHPDDLLVIGRDVGVRFIYKWADPDLWQQVYTGAVDGTAWTPSMYSTDVAAKLNSPNNISGTSTPYSIEITAPEVDWSIDGQLRLQGNNILYCPVTGVLKEPETGDPFQIRIVNDVASGDPDYYTWPS
jgi:hypothetical protein